VTDTWMASAARHRFSELVDAAVEGRPQFVRRRDGREVVVVSREVFEKTQPTLKSVLLTHRFGSRGDAFDQVLEEAHELTGAALLSRGAESGFAKADAQLADDDHTRHKRPE